MHSRSWNLIVLIGRKLVRLDVTVITGSYSAIFGYGYVDGPFTYYTIEKAIWSQKNKNNSRHWYQERELFETIRVPNVCQCLENCFFPPSRRIRLLHNYEQIANMKKNRNYH